MAAGSDPLAAGGPNVPSRFQFFLARIIEHIDEEHEREVSELRTRIDELTALLGGVAPRSPEVRGSQSVEVACKSGHSGATVSKPSSKAGLLSKLGKGAPAEDVEAAAGSEDPGRPGSRASALKAEDQERASGDDSDSSEEDEFDPLGAAPGNPPGQIEPGGFLPRRGGMKQSLREMSTHGLGTHMQVQKESHEPPPMLSQVALPHSRQTGARCTIIDNGLGLGAEAPEQHVRSRSWYKKRDSAVDSLVLQKFTLRGDANKDEQMEQYFSAWAQFVKDMQQTINFRLLTSWDANTVLPQVLEKHHELASSVTTSRAISPHSSWRLAWDIMGMALLLYDIIAIPLIAFQPPATTFTTTMDWFTISFWTLDMFVSTITGYVSGGLAVMDRKLIFKHYLKGWFPLDVTVVTLDWASTVMDTWIEASGDASAAKSGKLIRTLRVLRVARLLRLGKLARVMSIFKDFIDSEATFIWLNIGKLILAMIMVNHLQACGWYAMRDTSEASLLAAAGFVDTSLAYRYTTSLHYSFTQFIEPAPQPVTVEERLYAILMWINALVLFSSIVGSVSASITQIFGAQEDASQQTWLLRRYLKQRGINSDLKFRVLRYIEFSMQCQANLVSDRRIALLEHLSPQLNDELTFAVYYSCLNVHPLFYHLGQVADHTMISLCQTALAQQHLAPGDWLLNAGMAAGEMHMVVTGRLQYVKAEELSLEDPAVEIFGSGDWACEASLWTSWTCVGSSRTYEECTLVRVDSDMHAQAIVKDAMARIGAAGYARKYLTWLNSKRWRNLTDLARKDTIMETVEGFMRPDNPEENYGGWDMGIGLMAKVTSLVNANQPTSHLNKQTSDLSTLSRLSQVSGVSSLWGGSTGGPRSSGYSLTGVPQASRNSTQSLQPSSEPDSRRLSNRCSFSGINENSSFHDSTDGAVGILPADLERR